MSLVVQVIVTGLAAGGIYGLFAVGYSLIYRLTGVVYFAFGDLVSFAVFTTLLVAAGTAPVSQTSLSPGRFLLGLVVGLLLCVGVGAATYILFIEPYLLRGSTLGWVAATLAIAFALHGMVGAVFTRPAYVFPDPLPFDELGRDGVVTLAEGARFSGLPVERLVALTFGLVGALAALAAVLAAPSAPFTVDTGALLGLKGLVAALIVRFGSPWAAFAAGLGVGLAEAAIDNLRIGDLGLGPQYGEILPLAFALGLIAYRSLRSEPVPGRA